MLDRVKDCSPEAFTAASQVASDHFGSLARLQILQDMCGVHSEVGPIEQAMSFSLIILILALGWAYFVFRDEIEPRYKDEQDEWAAQQW